jgi:hypothetical protein
VVIVLHDTALAGDCGRASGELRSRNDNTPAVTAI